MPWWTEEITETMAIEFLKECQEYTREVIKKEARYLTNARYSHVIPNTIKPFTPIGAIVHSTRTPSIWDAMQVVASQSYGTHFILGMKQPNLKKYTYLNDFPCMIFMPMGLESAVPHAGYISNLTWGIDLRTIGKLRTYYSPLGGKPTPIFMGEQLDSDFKWTDRGTPKFYWSDDLWRTEFTGKVMNWGSYYYERPTFAQLKGLVILLRVLNALYPMKREFIMPECCIRSKSMAFPNINWDMIRQLALTHTDDDIDFGDFDGAFDNVGYDDVDDARSKDDIYIQDIAKNHLWKNEHDDGAMNFIMNGPEAVLSSQSKIKLSDLGHDITDIDLAARFFTLANNFRQDQVRDIEPLVEKIFHKHKGF